MEVSMNRGFKFFVGLLCLTLFVGLTIAAPISTITFETKFAFKAGGKDFQAGKYEVLLADENSPLEIRTLNAAKGTKGAFVPYQTRIAQSAPGRSEVVFDKAGEEYVLSEIHPPGVDGYYVEGIKGKHSHSAVKGGK